MGRRYLPMIIKPIPTIPGAFANDEGQIKLPEATATMPHGGTREYKTKWIYGVRRKAKTSAKHQYYGTIYRGKNYKIHRLICEAFHGPAPEDKPIVLHLNEDGLDNRPENLRWGTQKENLNMPKFIAYCKSRTGPDSPTSKSLANKLSGGASGIATKG
tara:strand:+ start:998 stop:1471 length:474 start_codon:yes stop_codon:yes gene_type:complete